MNESRCCEECNGGVVGEQTLCNDCYDAMMAESEDTVGDADEMGFDPYSGQYSEDC